MCYAAWPPGQPLSVGDVGVLQRGTIFVRQSSLKNLGITFRTVKDANTDDYTYKSTSVSEVSVGASTGLGPVGASANARLQVSFGGAEGIYFTAADGMWTSIDDQQGLGDDIVALHKRGKWNPTWAVVTMVFEARGTTVVTSQSKNAEVILEAASPSIQSIDLKDTSVKVNIKSSRDLGLQIVAKTGMTPLIGLSGLRKRFFGKPSWSPQMALTINRVPSDPALQAVGEESVVFGSLGIPDFPEMHLPPDEA